MFFQFGLLQQNVMNWVVMNNLIPPSSGCWKSKIKALADSLSGEDLPFGLWVYTISSHRGKERVLFSGLCLFLSLSVGLSLCLTRSHYIAHVIPKLTILLPQPAESRDPGMHHHIQVESLLRGLIFDEDSTFMM